MVNSKLIDSLKTLDDKEIKRFGAFISSPFFNTNSTLIKLFDILKKHYPKFSSKKLEKENIFARLYPGIEYKDGTFRNLLSDLAVLVQKFLIQTNFETDFNEINLRLLRQLDERKLDNLYASRLNDCSKSVESIISYSFFQDARMLEDTKVNYALKRGMQKSICENVLRRSEYNIYNFVINLLVDLNDLKINQDAYNAKYKHNLANEFSEKIDFNRIIEVIENSSPEYSHILKLFIYEGLAFLNAEDEQYYFKFKKMFFDNYNRLSENSKDNLFTSLENICIEKIFNGNDDFITEQFAVFKERLHRKAYKDETGDFNLYLFRNIALTAISNNEIAWLENFLSDYINELAGEFRGDMKNFVSALICFEKGEYHDSANNISRVNDKADIFKYTVYTLRLKIFFETDEHESAEYVLDSYSHYLNQSKSVSERFRNSNKEFLKVYQVLIKNKFHKYDKLEVSGLKEQIKKTKYFKEKTWLLKKIDELEKIK